MVNSSHCDPSSDHDYWPQRGRPLLHDPGEAGQRRLRLKRQAVARSCGGRPAPHLTPHSVSTALASNHYDRRRQAFCVVRRMKSTPGTAVDDREGTIKFLVHESAVRSRRTSRHAPVERNYQTTSVRLGAAHNIQEPEDRDRKSPRSAARPNGDRTAKREHFSATRGQLNPARP